MAVNFAEKMPPKRVLQMFHRFMLTYVLNDVRMRSISTASKSAKDKKPKYQAVVKAYHDNLAMEYGMYNDAATAANIHTNLNRFMNLIIGSIPMDGHEGIGKPIEAARAYVVSALFSQITTRIIQIGASKRKDQQPQIMITYLSRYLMIMMSALIRASNNNIEAILKDPKKAAGAFKTVVERAHAAAISKFQGNATTTATTVNAATTTPVAIESRDDNGDNGDSTVSDETDHISKYKNAIQRLSSALKKVVAENEELNAQNKKLRVSCTELLEQLNVVRQESQEPCENCRILERTLEESEKKLKSLRVIAREQKSKIDSFEKHVEHAVSSSGGAHTGQAVVLASNSDDDSDELHLGQPLMLGNSDDNAFSGSPIMFGDDDGGDDAVLSVGDEEKASAAGENKIIGGFIDGNKGDPLSYGDDVADALTIAGALEEDNKEW